MRERALIVLCMVLVSLATRAAGADERQGRALGFSKLIVRVDHDPRIGLLPDEFRVHILERLRGTGVRAVGAEDLVFEKDATGEAELLLGGTVRELECLTIGSHENCRIGIVWQVLDVASDAVIYETTTRFAAYGVTEAWKATLGKVLVDGALDSLVRRKGLRALLQARSEKPLEAAKYSRASFKRCSAGATPLPSHTAAATAATVVVESGKGFGSGFFVNDEGFVLTAAHVVRTQTVHMRLQKGTSLSADVIRLNRQTDIALLRARQAGQTPCLELGDRETALGTDVYAIGSPASTQLAFSVTRGIVSGVRHFEGVQFLQTDASISPGYSGGPMLDGQGRVLAVVSWKVLGSTIEGIAFGVPIGSGLEALAIAAADKTSAELSSAAPEVVTAKRGAERIIDAPDVPPSLDPVGDQMRDDELAAAERKRADAAEAEREGERERVRDAKIDALTPTYVKIMKWGGVGLAAASAIGIVATATQYDESTTQGEYETLRLVNDLSWIGLGLGAASFTTSLFLVPSLPPEQLKLPLEPTGPNRKSAAGVAVSGHF